MKAQLVHILLILLFTLCASCENTNVAELENDVKEERLVLAHMDNARMHDIFAAY